MVTGRTQHSEKREGLGRQINTIDGVNMEWHTRNKKTEETQNAGTQNQDSDGKYNVRLHNGMLVWTDGEESMNDHTPGKWQKKKKRKQPSQKQTQPHHFSLKQKQKAGFLFCLPRFLNVNASGPDPEEEMLHPTINKNCSPVSFEIPQPCCWPLKEKVYLQFLFVFRLKKEALRLKKE